MKTNQVMQSIDRNICGRIVRQRTKDEFFCLDDILSIGNLYRLENGLKPVNFSNYLTSDSTQDFLRELEKDICKPAYIKGAKNKSGWVHPFFGIKILTWFNPKFEVQVYKWLFDYLIQSRVNGGDSYQVMCGVLYSYSNNKVKFSTNIQKLANKIKDILKVDDWNCATNKQLQDRDLIHSYITDLTRTLKDTKQGVKLGIQMYLNRVGNLNQD
ncbi:KilA-N domain-containing protein [Campylobacter coli]